MAWLPGPGPGHRWRPAAVAVIGGDVNWYCWLVGGVALGQPAARGWAGVRGTPFGEIVRMAHIASSESLQAAGPAHPKRGDMRRDCDWWKRLKRAERQRLVQLEFAAKHFAPYGGGGYLPDDCSDCPGCGMPMLGVGLCGNCETERNSLIHKAEQGGKGVI